MFGDVGLGRGGRLATGAAGRWVGTWDAAIGNVLGPLGPRPVPLLMSARGVGQPTGRDAGKRDLAGGTSDGVSCVIRRRGVYE